jgi:hypothetical protein
VSTGAKVDEAFKAILRAIADDPLLRTFSELPGIEAELDGMLTQLDACQTALIEFLETKRSLFPRCDARGRVSSEQMFADIRIFLRLMR